MAEISFKLILAGDAGVGKTSLIVRYAEKEFEENYSTTIGIDFKIKKITRKGYKINLQIFDTAGQERFRSISKTYFKNVDGIFLIFDLTEKSSYENLDSWIDSINEGVDDPQELKSILLGNKSDKKEQKIFEENEIKKKFKYPYLETSAKKGTNVIKAFEEMIDLIIKDKTKEEIMREQCKNYNKINLDKKMKKKDKVECC